MKETSDKLRKDFCSLKINRKKIYQFYIFLGARIDVLLEGAQLEGIFLTTTEMRARLQDYPEVVGFDGTYKLFANDIVVQTFTVINSDFLTEFAGIAFVFHEDQGTFDWLFESFKKHQDGSCENIKFFVTDKDQTQRTSLKKIFPHVELLLCAWHAEESFKRELNVLKPSADEKKDCKELFIKIIYAETEKEFSKLYKKLCKEAPKSVVDYFNKNWLDLRYEFSIRGHQIGNLKTFTNNREETVNAKIKQWVTKCSSFLGGLTELLAYMEAHDITVRKKLGINFSTSLSIPPKNPDDGKYRDINVKTLSTCTKRNGGSNLHK